MPPCKCTLQSATRHTPKSRKTRTHQQHQIPAHRRHCIGKPSQPRCQTNIRIKGKHPTIRQQKLNLAIVVMQKRRNRHPGHNGANCTQHESAQPGLLPDEPNQHLQHMQQPNHLPDPTHCHTKSQHRISTNGHPAAEANPHHIHSKNRRHSSRLSRKTFTYLVLSNSTERCPISSCNIGKSEKHNT